MAKGISAVNFLFRTMNCNVEILKTFRYATLYGEAEITKGETYSGTAADGGGVVFHVELQNGKIAPVLLESNDGRIKILTYANPTQK